MNKDDHTKYHLREKWHIMARLGGQAGDKDV
jgi:hypothetical protein